MKTRIACLFFALLLAALPLLASCGGEPAETETEKQTETEPATEPGTESETEPATEPGSETDEETLPPETESETEAATETAAETEPATETEPETETETETETEPPVETESETETEKKTETETEPPPPPNGTLEISEICTGNRDVFRPQNAKNGGYVEFYNPGTIDTRLAPFMLVLYDNEGNRKNVSLSGTLAPDAYFVVEIPAGFEQGGIAQLMCGDYRDVVPFPALPENLAYTKETGVWAVMTPTPGKDCEDALTDYLQINEVCSQNKTLYVEGDASPDYVELRNASPYPLDLSGYLVGDAKDPAKAYALPEGTRLEPGGLLLILADGEGTQPLHAPFGISASGENLYLFDPSGARLQKLEVPALEEDIAYGCYPDGGNYRMLCGTPGESNDGAKLPMTAPVLSAVPGFYNDPFTLTMTADDGCVIYYTTDGTTPTLASTRYVTGIAVTDRSSEANQYASRRDLTVKTSGNGSFVCTAKVDKCTVIKAISVNAQGEVSDMVTGVYFVGYQNRTGYQNVTVMSISTDPSYFFDYNTGIYVTGYIYDTQGNGGTHEGNTPANYKQKGRAWEREVTMSVFNPDGSYGFSQQVGVRIHGGWSRGFNQKSLNVYCRKEYGSNTVLEPFFDTDKLKDFMLRTGGYRDTFYTKMRDPLNQRLIADRPQVATQDNKACVLFLNGEYWGVFSLQERFCAAYVEENYGVDKDDVIMIRMGGIDEGTSADKKLWDDMIAFFNGNNLSDPAKYAEACNLIDVQSFIDYMATEIYVNNADWPTNNFRAWRSRSVTDAPYNDGKWRFMLYDTDDCADVPDIGGKVTANADGFANGSHWAGGPLDKSGALGAILVSLLRNADFREQFATSFCDLCNVNFRYERVHALITEMAAEFGDPMVNFYHRWVTTDQNWNRAFFDKQVTTLDNFFKVRRDIICNYMVQHFKQLGYSELNAGEATVNVNHDKTKCAVSFNTVPADSLPEAFSGRYYVGLHVCATAVAEEGYTVKGWRVTVNGVTSTVTGNVAVVTVPSGTVTLEPIVE